MASELQINQNQWSKNMLLIQKLNHISTHLLLHSVTKLKTSGSW